MCWGLEPQGSILMEELCGEDDLERSTCSLSVGGIQHGQQMQSNSGIVQGPDSHLV